MFCRQLYVTLQVDFFKRVLCMRHICFTEAEVKTLMRILEREFSATKKLSQFNELRALLDKMITPKCLVEVMIVVGKIR